MKRRLTDTLFPILILILAVTIAFPAYPASAADSASDTAQTAAGSWTGAIVLPNGELGIVVTLTPSADGTWSGTIDIPAQGLKDFALSEVSVDSDAVHFEMAGVPGVPTFDGTLSEGAESIAGSFQQGGQTLEFHLEPSDDDAASGDSPAAETETGVPGDGLVGNWKGTLNAGGTNLRLALNVERGDDDALEAVLNSLDQGTELPIAAISLNDGTMSFSIPRISGSFEGKLNKDGSAAEGTWTQAGQTFPLIFYRTEEAFALNRPQEPKPPFPYSRRDVTFANPTAEIELAGTLIIPEGDGPFPSVVFVTGSGAQDRDEALMGHRPFWVIADYLARRGIASLRYDDRGVFESGGDHMSSTVDDFATDVAAAVAFLAEQEGVDREALGIVGHSEGGLSGPKAAMTVEEIDFLVLLAPPGEALDALVQRQSADALRLNGVDEELIARALKGQAEDLEWVKDESLSTEQLQERLRARVAEQANDFTEAELALLQVTPATIEQGIQVSSTAWFRSLIREDPAVYLKQLKLPVLALFGAKDVQVDAEVNAAILRSSLEAAGNEDFEVRTLPELNHLFQHAETGAVAEYNTIEETFAPEALEIIGDWILERFAGS